MTIGRWEKIRNHVPRFLATETRSWGEVLATFSERERRDAAQVLERMLALGELVSLGVDTSGNLNVRVRER